MNKFLSVFYILLSATLWSQTDVLVENFENGIPASWTILDNDHLTLDPSVASTYTSPWISIKNPDNDTEYVASCASYFSPEGGTASRWLITPQINLGAYGNYIHWKAKSQDPSYPDSYLLLISTTGTNVADFTDTIYNGENTAPLWLNLTASISDSGYNNQAVYLAFVDNSFYGYKLYLDSVRIEKESTASLSENTENKTPIKVYPNPSHHYVNIDCIDMESVLLIDLNGKVVAESRENKLDVSYFDTGIYLLKIISKQGVFTQKLKIE